MKAHLSKLISIIVVAAAFHSSLHAVEIITADHIYTASSKETIEAFAIDDKKIVATGALEDLEQQFEGAKITRFDGKTIIPGLIDAHAHLLSLGLALSRVDLVGAKSKTEALERMQDFAQQLEAGEWLLGRGWDQNDWPEKDLPTAADLDASFPKRPVWLTRIDGHAGWANSAAMKLVEKDLSGTWQIEGGEIIRDKEKRATGVFIDKAESIIADLVPQPSATQLRRALLLAMEKTAAAGLTGVHNAGTSLTVWKQLEALSDSGELNIRYYAMADDVREMFDHLCENGVTIDDENMLTARSIKLYSDGALGSRGAALHEPYSDRADTKGLLLDAADTLREKAVAAAKCGLQVNIHAIGDKGNSVALDAIEAAKANTKEANDLRHRIEHAQVVRPKDFVRFKSLEVIASVQPTHATSDMYWAEERLGAERIGGAYAWRTFVEHQVPLALGSDFPVERVHPLLGFHAAISRQDAKGWPENGWYPEQRLSRQETLRGFTIGAAYAAFEEDTIGSIEAGKYADFVVLSNDIMQVPPATILTTKVNATYLNGKAIFQSSD